MILEDTSSNTATWQQLLALATTTTSVFSKNVGKPLYQKETFFSNVGLALGNPNSNYNVTEYIYACSKISVVSNMIGYIAVASDSSVQDSGRRDILVSFRGTMRNFELKIDFDVLPPASLFPDLQDVHVHKGWSEYYTSQEDKTNSTSCREQVMKEISWLLDVYKNEKLSITIVGHSMGAALATLCGVDIAYNNVNAVTRSVDMNIPVTVLTYACPMVGVRGKFGELFEDLKTNNSLRILRIRNKLDGVPDLPPLGFAAVGRELVVDHSQSPFLKDDIKGKSGAHDIEVHLHMLAGPYIDENGEPKLRVERQLLLLNKGMDALVDETIAPASWWVDKNKGLVQGDDGIWRMGI